MDGEYYVDVGKPSVCRLRGGGVEEAVAEGIGGGLRTIVGVDLAIDIGSVPLDSVDAQE